MDKNQSKPSNKVRAKKSAELGEIGWAPSPFLDCLEKRNRNKKPTRNRSTTTQRLRVS